MRLLALLCWLLCLPLAQAQVRPYDDIVASGVLKVAVYENFPPYSFQQDGQARGVDVDLANALAEALGLKAELIWVIPGEKLDDDLRNYIWKGHYLRPKLLADVMLRVPYDRDYTARRNDVGELVNEQVVIFAPTSASAGTWCTTPGACRWWTASACSACTPSGSSWRACRPST